MKNIRFTILPLGCIENDLAWNISVPFPLSKDDLTPRAQMVRVPSFAVLIDHPREGYILYDTGSCPGDEADRLPEYARAHFPLYIRREEFLDKRLEALGLKPGDVSAVIISHMHWDHSGGLKFFEDTRAAENIFVNRDDYMYGLAETHRSKEKFGGGGYFKDNFEFEGLNFNLIDEDYEFAEGLRIAVFKGHTPGILGLVAELDGGNYIFPSDAVYMAKNYGPPAISPGNVYDSLGFMHSASKLRMLERQYRAKIIYPHDPDQFAGLKLAPYFYER